MPVGNLLAEGVVSRGLPAGCLGAYCTIQHLKVPGEEFTFMGRFGAKPVILSNIISQV